MYRWKSINGITLGCLIAHGDKDHLKYKKKSQLVLTVVLPLSNSKH